MNKCLLWIAAAAVVMLSGCGTAEVAVTEEPTDTVPAQIDVYVQTPLIGVMDAVTSKYNRDRPEHTVIFCADTAENLEKAISDGEKCDILIVNDETAAELDAKGLAETITELISDRYVRVATNDDEPQEKTMLGSEAVYEDVTVIEELSEPAESYSAVLLKNDGNDGAAEEYFQYILSYKAANVYEWFGFVLK